MLAGFFLVIDVWRIRAWAQPFVWIGMNAITIFLLDNVVGLSRVVRRVIHEDMIEAIDPWGDLLVALLKLVLAVAICYVLYRKKIFIRV